MCPTAVVGSASMAAVANAPRSFLIGEGLLAEQQSCNTIDSGSRAKQQSGHRASCRAYARVVTRQRPAAESRFERYLDAHAYGWEHEPDLGIATAPDYRIRRGDTSAICEVKQFETTAIRELGARAGGPVIIPPELSYRTIRNQIDSAARQLRPLADRGLPLVVVLANPSRATVLLDPPTLFHAMYGGAHWAAPDDPLSSIETWPIPTAAGRDGAMTAKHDFISAIVALQVRRDPGASFDAPVALTSSSAPYAHVVDALSSSAVPVPTTVFDGASDARWSPDRDRRYRQVTGVLRPGSVRDDDA